MCGVCGNNGLLREANDRMYLTNPTGGTSEKFYVLCIRSVKLNQKQLKF